MNYDRTMDMIEATTIDEARLQMVHDLHVAVHGDVWARPESPEVVWHMLLTRVREWRAEVDPHWAACLAERRRP